MQVADSAGVFAIACIGLAWAGVVVTLRIQSTDALLHAQVDVDERRAHPPTMVDAKLRFGDTVAADRQLAVFDIIVGAQVRQSGIERGLAQGISVHDALGLELMVLAVAVLLEVDVG